MKVSALLAPEPIPLSLFTQHPEVLDQPLRSSASDPDALSDALGAAVRFSLARRQGNTFQLHRLVQSVIRDRIPPAEQDRIGATVGALVAAAHPGDPNDPAHAPRNWWPPPCRSRRFFKRAVVREIYTALKADLAPKDTNPVGTDD